MRCHHYNDKLKRNYKIEEISINIDNQIVTSNVNFNL